MSQPTSIRVIPAREMTVNELIEELKKFDGNQKVMIDFRKRRARTIDVVRRLVPGYFTNLDNGKRTYHVEIE